MLHPNATGTSRFVLRTSKWGVYVLFKMILFDPLYVMLCLECFKLDRIILNCLYSWETYPLQAPVGKKIEVRLNKGDLYCDPMCYRHGVEVFTRGVLYGGYKSEIIITNNNQNISLFDNVNCSYSFPCRNLLVILYFRLCCTDAVKGKVFQSQENIMPIRLYSLWGKPVMNVEYRMVWWDWCWE